jgi:hypothetical protein
MELPPDQDGSGEPHPDRGGSEVKLPQDDMGMCPEEVKPRKYFKMFDGKKKKVPSEGSSSSKQPPPLPSPIQDDFGPELPKDIFHTSSSQPRATARVQLPPDIDNINIQEKAISDPKFHAAVQNLKAELSTAAHSKQDLILFNMIREMRAKARDQHPDSPGPLDSLRPHSKDGGLCCSY